VARDTGSLAYVVVDSDVSIPSRDAPSPRSSVTNGERSGSGAAVGSAEATPARRQAASGNRNGRRGCIEDTSNILDLVEDDAR
jgi:hypothetical protein